jgi:hypothetical protein
MLKDAALSRPIILNLYTVNGTGFNAFHACGTCGSIMYDHREIIIGAFPELFIVFWNGKQHHARAHPQAITAFHRANAIVLFYFYFRKRSSNRHDSLL